MKKLLLFIAIIISSVGLFAQNVGDNTIIDYEGYSLKFTVTSVEPAECEVSGYEGEPVDVTIPSTVTISGKEYTVTSIGYEAFYECSGLTSVTFGENSQLSSIGVRAFSGCSSLTSIEIPSGVTYIGDYAFQHCENLTSIEIPSGVTSIGEGAFSYCSSLTSIDFGENSQLSFIGDLTFFCCSSLTSIEIPSGVTYIGHSAFSGCSSLTSIEIPSGVTSIRESTFSNCSSLTSIEIPNGVTSIGYYAFSGCSGLTSIEIPSGVTSIGIFAFSGCSSLTSIEIPSGVTSIGNFAFSGCSSLTSIEIPSGVTSIGNYAFSGCSGLTSIEIPSGVTSIGYEAFSSCSSLTSIEIPSGVTSISNYAFSRCSSLTSIEIPSGVTYIGGSAFSGCSGLTSVTFGENSQLTSIGDYAFKECSSLTSIEIPNGVTSIGNYAFSSCSSLTSIEIPSGVTSIDNYVFSRCSSLTSIEIPSGVTSIGEDAFSRCSSLTSIEFEENSLLTFIGNSAFESCSSLTSIEIPSGVTSIRNDAFRFCENLTSIYCYAESVPETYSDTFYNCPSDMVIYVPAQSVGAYQAASPWNNYTIKPIENHWVPDESLYANNMSVIGLIQIDSVNQNSTSLEIGAFCGEEVRGSQLVQYIPALDKYLVFLTIHGEGSEEISFKLYDHSIGEELDLRSPEAITFTVNGTLGSVTSPYILNFNNMVEITAVVNPNEAGTVTGTGIYAVYDTATLVTTPNEGFAFKNWTINGNVVSTDSEYSFVVTEAVELVANYNYVQTRELKSGWSWFSSFIEFEGEEGLEMMEDALGENGLQIKNQTEFVVNSDGAWYGSLMAANSDMMFMLETSAPQTFTLVGPKVNPEEHPLTVGTNWRWISYPLDINLSVEEALATIVPQTGDYIKSKNAFSQYYEGAGWLGALSTMNPGEGYMYQNVSGTTKTLVYPSESATRSMKANVTAENNYWVPNAEKFAGNMSVIAVVESNGIEMSDYEIAAFVGDEIRGSARPIYIEVLDKHMIFMTVYGSGKEEVTFKYYDINADAIENVTSREEIVFADNATYGSIDNAIVLTCGVTGIGENDTEALNVYPNPANINAEISLGTTYDRVEIYNAIGVKIAEYADVNRIGGIEAAGVYVIKVTNDDVTRNCRIVIR